MARPVYSELLASGTITGTATAEVVLPDPYTWVVRDISGRYLAGDTGGGLVIFGINDIGFFDVYFPQKRSGFYHWEGRVVAPGPTTLSIACPDTGAAAQVAYLVSGYRLTP